MDIVVIEFDGGIEQFPRLVQAVDNVIADGSRHLVVDLDSLPFINSAALGYLLKAHKTLAAHEGEIVLARVQPAILNILEMTELDAVVPSFSSIEEAVTYLGGDPDQPGPAPGRKAVRRAAWR